MFETSDKVHLEAPQNSECAIDIELVDEESEIALVDESNLLIVPTQGEVMKQVDVGVLNDTQVLHMQDTTDTESKETEEEALARKTKLY